MIDSLLNSLESLSREDLRRVSNIDHTVAGILKMSLSEINDMCNHDLDSILRLRLQLIRIHVFDVYYRDLKKAMSLLNNTLQLIHYNDNLKIYQFEYLYFKALIYHFSRDKKQALEVAYNMYQIYWDTSSPLRKAKIAKLMSITSIEVENAIKYAQMAIQYFRKSCNDLTEIGWIHKNLGFYFLQLEDVQTSLYHILNYLKLAPQMDEPEIQDILVISGYIGMLDELDSDDDGIDLADVKEQLLTLVTLKENGATEHSDEEEIVLRTLSGIIDSGE